MRFDQSDPWRARRSVPDCILNELTRLGGRGACGRSFDRIQPGDDLQDPYILPTPATVRDQLLKAEIRLVMILDLRTIRPHSVVLAANYAPISQ
jgi:hypothetical protein